MTIEAAVDGINCGERCFDELEAAGMLNVNETLASDKAGAGGATATGGRADRPPPPEHAQIKSANKSTATPERPGAGFIWRIDSRPGANSPSNSELHHVSMPWFCDLHHSKRLLGFV